jgi:uncharacterized protein YhbP (UPF0306 family)
MSDRGWQPQGTAPPTPADDPAVVEILETSTLALSTAGPAGRPFVTPVFFAATDDLSLIFFSDQETLHVRHVMVRPQAAVTVYPSTSDWLEIRGLQLAGTVERIEPGEDWELAWAAYVRKFPFVAGLRSLVDSSWLLTFQSTWIRLIDNRRGFGFKREWLRGEPFDE